METLAARIARGGALQDVDAVSWAIRLAKSVERIHAGGKVHGHLSPRSVAIERDTASSRGELIPAADAPYLVAYHSPERAAGGGTSAQDDTWAVAVILYEALTGALPFVGSDDAAVRRSITSVAPTPLAQYGAGDADLQALLDRALARDPEARIRDATELRRALQSWRPTAVFARIPPLEERMARKGHDEEDEDFDPDAVTRIRGDIGPMLQDLIKAASVGDSPGAEQAPVSRPAESRPAESRPAESRPAESRPPPGKSKVTAGSTITALASLGMGGSSGSQVARMPTARPPASKAEPEVAIPEAPRAPLPSEGEDALENAATSVRPSPFFNAGRDSASAGPFNAGRDSASAGPFNAGRDSASAGPFNAGRDSASAGPFNAGRDSASAGPFNAGRDSASERDDATIPFKPPASSRSAGEEKAPASGAPAPEPAAETSEPNLPGLLDEESHAEGENLFPVPGARTKLDAPQRAAKPVAAAQEKEPAPSSPDAAEVPASPASSGASLPSAGEPAKGRRWATPIVFVVAALAGGGVTAWFWSQSQKPTDTGALVAVPSAPAASAAAAPAASSAAEPAASAAAEPAASAAAEPAASAAAEPAASAAAEPAASSSAEPATPGATQDVDACVAPLFAEGTFPRKVPDLDFVCAEADPRRGIAQIKKQIVLAAANGIVSDGMREWALLGWYELATFAVMRARCCSGAPPLKLPASPPPCARLDKTLDELGAAAVAAEGVDDPELEKARKRFHETLYCLVKTGGTSAFGYEGPPRGGQDTTFNKTLARVVGKR